MNRWQLWLLERLQDRCVHPGNKVAADILQRDHLPLRVLWCRICGAYAATYGVNPPVFRRPEPLW